MEATPPVSVVIPFHDDRAHLGEALWSVSAQSLGDFEAVLVDDGSTDGSEAIARQHARGDPRFRLLRQDNRGGAAARNRGIAAARAPLIALMDADDVALPDRLRRQVDFLAAHPEVVVLSGATELIDESGRVLGRKVHPTGHEAIIRLLRQRGAGLHDPAVMMRRSAFEAAGGYREQLRVVYDLDLWLRMLPGRFANLPDTLTRYRQHPGQVTRRHAMLTSFTGVLVGISHRRRVAGAPEPLARWDGRLDLTALDRLGLSVAEQAVIVARLLQAAAIQGGGGDTRALSAEELLDRLWALPLSGLGARNDAGPFIRAAVRYWRQGRPARAVGFTARLAVTAPTAVAATLARKGIDLVRGHRLTAALARNRRERPSRALPTGSGPSEPKPRILLVAHWDWVLAHFRLSIARALRDDGAEVVFVCPPGDDVVRLQEAGFAWVPWPVDRRGLAPHREVAAIVRLAAIYRGGPPRASHHYTVKPVLYGSLAARVVPHAVAVNVFSGLGFLFGDDRRARALRRMAVPALRRALRRPRTHTYALTETDRRRLEETLGLSAKRTGVLPEGVDTERFRPPATTQLREPPVVLLACRLLYDKGVGDLVAAVDRLRTRGVDVRARIAGAPDPGNPTSVGQAQLAAWGRREGVELLGRRDDVDALLRDADVAVLPTRYGEGVPWFLLEAAATGLPVVATDLPGCRAVVEDGHTGLLVAPGDVEALADALATLLTDPDLRARFGRRARERAEREFADVLVRDAHVTLYRELGVLPRGDDPSC